MAMTGFELKKFIQTSQDKLEGPKNT